jgi:metal-sulfur cluster biosynthetic enzyme
MSARHDAAGDEVRIAEVRAALDRVTDPELDESVVDLGFITAITLTAYDAVDVAFRLPTYWCAANFSYLMASDMREAVLGLPWVRRAGIHLDEHMYGEAINDGIAHGKDFTEAFPAEDGQDLSAIRRNFALKSFERRQEPLLRHLLAADHTPEAIATLSLAGLEALVLDDEGAALRTRYLERRHWPQDILTDGEGARFAFVTREGERLMPETLGIYLRHIRRIGLNAEFNGALCRGLLASRYPGTAPAAAPAFMEAD